jgi:hypothetical protein
MMYAGFTMRLVAGTVLLFLLAACNRQSAAVVPDEELTKVESLRPGPDEADRALLQRLRQHFDAALEIEALVRDGDVWLVAFTYDELDAWWREVHRTGRAAEVRAELRRRRLACEAALLHPEEDATELADETFDDFDIEPENGMDERSCWDRALASLGPREGPIEHECFALSIARVTNEAIEELWSFHDVCLEELTTFELNDVAGAGWPQLVLHAGGTRWGMTRLGFQAADTTESLVVIDPRTATDAVMLDQTVSYETLVDEAWRWSGSYAHVEFERGRHVTVLEQDWATTDECSMDASGWAVPEARDEDDDSWFDPCEVAWTMTRTPWDPATQRWHGKAETMPRPKRLPARDELPLATTRYPDPR